jgi:hypothetical protein
LHKLRRQPGATVKNRTDRIAPAGFNRAFMPRDFITISPAILGGLLL